MAWRFRFHLRVILCAGVVAAGSSRAQEQNSAPTQEQFRQLQKQNETLLQQMQKQQQLIEDLSRRVNDLQYASTNRATFSLPTPGETVPASKYSGFSLGKVSLGGEGAVGFMDSGSDGRWPNGEFVLDEAKL